MYSQDFRRLAVSLYNEGRSFSRVARLLRISSSTVHRWVTSGAAVRKRKRRPLTDRLLAEVASFVRAHPTTTHNDVRGHLLASLCERLGVRTVARLLTALKLPGSATAALTPAPETPPPEPADSARVAGAAVINTPPLERVLRVWRGRAKLRRC